MNGKLSILHLGWVFAAALAAVLLAGGFGQPAEKTAVVDISKVVEQSNFGKGNQATFAKMKEAREGLLVFLDTNRVLTSEQAQRLRDLSLKPNPATEEKAEIERIRADVVAAAKRSQELATKPNLTPEERNLLEEYARRGQNMDNTAQRWLREFTTEMQVWADKQKLDSITRARVAIQDVAKAQGYTIVFEVGVAPYGANDISDAVLGAMNAKG
jgi:Skp family chaperone for outer membrane proteins